MDLGIAGKWALVCAASKGLGFGCAQALVAEGVNVVINARTAGPLQQAAEKLRATAADWARASGQKPPQVIAVACDITTPEGRAAVLRADGGPGVNVDILVNTPNCAGDHGAGVTGCAGWPKVPFTTSVNERSSRRMKRCAWAQAKLARPSSSARRRAR